MLRLEHVHKTFVGNGRNGKPIGAVRDISINVGKGEFIALLGPSGSGKSTVLRCAAGLEVPSSGRIVVGDRCVFGGTDGTFVPPGKRNIGVVFQSYAIWPHMTVEENVAFPLVGRAKVTTRRTNRAEWKMKVSQVLATVGLEEFADRRAGTLSGGQQQRVAFARAVVCEPRVLLLDEPLSNLDLKLRERLRLELRRLQRELGITTVYVTHDQTDALSLADRVVVLRKGQVAQIGSPSEVYERPTGQFVADFVGNGNFIKGRLEEQVSHASLSSVRTNAGGILCGWKSPTVTQDRSSRVLAFVRPEHVSLRSCDDSSNSNSENNFGDNQLVGVVMDRLYFGELVEYFVDMGNNVIMRVRCRSVPAVGIGSRVILWWSSAATGVLPLSDSVDDVAKGAEDGQLETVGDVRE